MIMAAASTFRLSGLPLPARQANAARRLGNDAVTCSYETKVTIYSCRN
jgi:hypothetical protein